MTAWTEKDEKEWQRLNVRRQETRQTNQNRILEALKKLPMHLFESQPVLTQLSQSVKTNRNTMVDWSNALMRQETADILMEALLPVSSYQGMHRDVPDVLESVAGRYNGFPNASS